MSYWKKWTTAVVTGAAALGLMTTGAVNEAAACGGLFCDSGNNQVNQSAERIIFSHNGDGTVTAVVEIVYNGNAADFSWVLPVPGIPELSVGSTLGLQRLQNATNPTYTLQTRFEGECGDLPNNDSNNDVNNDVNNDGGVSVVASGAVGPFDFEVISVDPETEDAADAAVAWLTENGYDVTALGPDVLRPYLEAGMNLIGFRLQKTATTGSIRPIIMTYDTDDPMIPIKPTAVAVDDNMGILTFVLGQERAIPANYRHLVLNEAAIDWFNPNTNYRDVIQLAADESGGQGFVTEFAGNTSPFVQAIVTARDERNITNLIAIANSDDDEGQLVLEAALALGAWDGFADVLRQTNALASLDISPEEYLGCLGCLELPADIPDFTSEAFMEALNSDVIEPMRKMQELLGTRPYMTRLFTTMSAFEMTVDPVFSLNPDLPDVSNQHVATRIFECAPDVSAFASNWRVEFDNGFVVRGQGNRWPVSTRDMPANAEILQMSTQGDGELITDNSALINAALAENNEKFPSPGENNGGQPDDNNGGQPDDGGAPGASKDDDSCACATPTTPATPAPAAGAFLLLGLALVLRRRR